VARVRRLTSRGTIPFTGREAHQLVHREWPNFDVPKGANEKSLQLPHGGEVLALDRDLIVVTF
jgi:hypothetical protein